MLMDLQLGQSTDHSTDSGAGAVVLVVGGVLVGAASLDSLSETPLSAYQVHQITALIVDCEENEIVHVNCQPMNIKVVTINALPTSIV